MPEVPKRSKRIVQSGDWGTVEYAVRANGTMEAKEWLDIQTDSTRASFDHLFRTLANGQRIFNKTQFRILRDGIWEFKRAGDRLLTFQHGNAWFLTHHYPKGGSRKTPKRVIDRAVKIRSECIKFIES